MRTRRSGLKYIKHKDNPTSFKKGIVPWNKGLKGYKAGEKHYNFGKKRTEEVKIKISATKQGIDKENWKEFKNTTSRRQRIIFKNIMQQQILERDNYTCQLCGIKGGTLHVDHIQSWSDYVELRFSMDNCRTVCVNCHYKITFGRPMPKDSTWGNTFMRGGEEEGN